MDYKKIELFEVLEQIREVNYRFKLLKKMRINLIFHILLLEPALQDAPTIALDLSKENEIVEYEVLDIIKQATGEDDQPLYRVRWKGHLEEDDT